MMNMMNMYLLLLNTSLVFGSLCLQCVIALSWIPDMLNFLDKSINPFFYESNTLFYNYVVK